MICMKKFLYSLSILLVMLLFQNCGMQAALNQTHLLSTNKLSGNGGGYEGKPEGTYYHYIPSFTCEGKTSAEQVTEIINGQAFLYENKNNQCGNQSAPIPISDINISPFQKEFISVKDSLFKRYEVKPVGIPNNIAEILCRDDFENPTFEIISHYDREKNEALTRVYLADQQISDFSVSRILSMNEVQYVSKNVAFKVDLSKAAFPNKKFAGQINSSTIVGLPVRPLVCVIGGSLDTSKWSLKVLTNTDAGFFKLLKNNEIYFFSEVSRTYFSSQFFNSVTHVFKIGVDNVVSDFSKLILGEEYNVKYQIGPVDDSLLIYSAKLVTEIWPSMFVHDVRTGKTKKLTNLVSGADPEAFLLNNPVLTADQHLFYDTQIINYVGRNTSVVRVYNFKDDSILDVSPIHASAGYSVLPKTNKLLIYWPIKNNIKNVIQIYDAPSKTSTDLKVQVPDNCMIAGYGIEVLTDESSILASEGCDVSKSNFVQVSLITGQVKILGADSYLSWISNDKNRIIMTDSQNFSTAYDLKTGASSAIPIDPRSGYNLTTGATDFILSNQLPKVALVNDRLLYGFGGDNSMPTM